MSDDETGRIARVLMDTWAKAGRGTPLFGDLAKAIVADRAEAARTASLRTGLRVMDIAWQAYRASSLQMADRSTDEAREDFVAWWALRVGQGCAMPTCEKCGHEAST